MSTLRTRTSIRRFKMSKSSNDQNLREIVQCTAYPFHEDVVALHWLKDRLSNNETLFFAFIEFNWTSGKTED